jgi:hypothetical protein
VVKRVKRVKRGYKVPWVILAHKVSRVHLGKKEKGDPLVFQFGVSLVLQALQVLQGRKGWRVPLDLQVLMER